MIRTHPAIAAAPAERHIRTMIARSESARLAAAEC